MIQARMGSARLPGKISLPLGNSTILGMMIERCKRVRLARQTVVLTTAKCEDDHVLTLAKPYGVKVYRGSEDDLINRYLSAVLYYGTHVVVRLTGDCPFMDPGLINDMLNLYLSNWPNMEYLTNCYTRTYARGMDVEVFSKGLLQLLDRQCVEPYYREHVVPYVEEHTEKFAFFEYPNCQDDSRYRLTIDTEDDYHTILDLYRLFNHDYFSYRELIEALSNNEGLIKNAKIVHKSYQE